MKAPDRLVKSDLRTAKAERVHPRVPSPGDATVPNPLRIFSWGYEGWGNAAPRLVHSVDLAEAARGYAPPVFVDVRIRRLVRAVGFRDRAFERLLGHQRYRWMPSLGNPQVRDRRAQNRVQCKDAAHQLLDLALDAARQRRRVIFFCSCHTLFDGCHRHDVAKWLLQKARQRGYRVLVEGWPGGRPKPSPLALKVSASTLEAVRAGRKTIPIPRAASLATLAGLPWGTLVHLRAGDERQACSVGPAAFQRGRWVLPLFPEEQDFEARRQRLRATALRKRRQAKLDPRTR
jgi:hypothetical protein